MVPSSGSKNAIAVGANNKKNLRTMLLAAQAFLAVLECLAPWLVLILDGYDGDMHDMWDAEARRYSFESSTGDVALFSSIRGLIVLASVVQTALAPHPADGNSATLDEERTGCGRACSRLHNSYLWLSLGFMVAKAILFREWGQPFPETVVLLGITGAVGQLVLAHLRSKNHNNAADTANEGMGRSVNSQGYARLEGKEAEGDGEASDSEAKAATRVTVRRMLRLAKPELGTLVVASVALVIASAGQMAIPALFGRLATKLNEGGGTAGLERVVLEMLAVFLVMSVFAFLRAWLFTLAGERLVARFRKQVFASLVAQDVAFFDQTNSAELVNRLASDTAAMQDALTVNVSMGLRWSCNVLAGLAILFVLSPTLTGIMLAVVPAIAIGAVLFGRFVRKISANYQKALASAGMVAGEVLGSIRTVRSFAMEPKETQRYAYSIDDSFRLGAKRALAIGAFGGGVGLLAYSAISMVLWYGGRLVLRGQMSAGELLSFLLYTIFIAFALGGLSSLYGTLMSAVGASQRMFELLDRIPKIDIKGQGLSEAKGGEKLRGLVELQDVVFAYPTRKDVTVLKGVSLACQPGQTIALVGASGAGKSTVMALLERFYDPDSGEVRIDGFDLRRLDPKWLHSQMAIVAQEPDLFACSIRENILYGIKSTHSPPPAPKSAKIGESPKRSGVNPSKSLSTLERTTAAPGEAKYHKSEPQRTNSREIIDEKKKSLADVKDEKGALSERKSFGGESVRKHSDVKSTKNVLVPKYSEKDGKSRPENSTWQQSGEWEEGVLGSEESLQAAVVAAAKQAHCHDFIMEFPDGYDTIVGERGVQLSGGQKQRVAIARAIMLRPKVLLLDEATSALDAESEHLVTKALDSLMANCTTIVIAHRLSTVRNADKVVVLAKGRVVEQGTHESLIRQPNGSYRQLVERQLTHAQPNDEENA